MGPVKRNRVPNPAAGKRQTAEDPIHLHPLFSGEKGAVLIALIIGVTLVASLGTAIVSYYSSSTSSQAGAYDANRAYYLAEAGGRYAIRQIVNLEYTANAAGTASAADRAALVTALDNQTFSFSNEGQFTLHLAYADDVYTLTSTGRPNSGTLRTITFNINVYVPPGGINGVDVPFDKISGPTLNPINWNVVGSTDPEDSFTSDELGLDSESGDVMASFNSDNNCSGSGSGSLPFDLHQVWSKSGNFLTYEIKVKIRFLHMAFHNDLNTGIAFRLKTGADKTSMDDDNFYAISYLLYKPTHYDSLLWNLSYYLLHWESFGPSMWDTFFSNKSQSDFASDNAYIVLWKQTCNSCGGSPTRTVLQMANVSGYSADPVNEKAYLVVRVKEQENDSKPNGRENLISVYVADDSSSSGIRTKYDDWNYDNTSPMLENVTWGETDNGTIGDNADDAGDNCIWLADPNDPSYSHCWLSDSTFTTENYPDNCASFPDEIGFFAIGPEEAAMSDLGIRFNFNAQKPIVY